MADTYLTEQDEQNYGRELIDFAQRAGLQAVAPQLQGLQEQNAQLRRQLARELRHRLDQQVEQAVPNFREIDADPRWHRWLLGIDSLTGRQRQLLLNDAVEHRNSSRVKEFFARFQREVGGTPQTYSAVSRPAASSNKPIYTRRLIAELYERHRKGEFDG